MCSLYRGFVISRFFFTYFIITGVNEIVRYTDDFVVQKFVTSRFHCKKHKKFGVVEERPATKYENNETMSMKRQCTMNSSGQSKEVQIIQGTNHNSEANTSQRL